MSIDELMAALEAATGPSPMLDFHIWQFLNPEFTPARGWTGADIYTLSIDAALSLVPEGWNALVYTTGAARVWPIEGKRSDDLSHGSTPAIALCIAALKARAAS